jgi:hypothetical protein
VYEQEKMNEILQEDVRQNSKEKRNMSMADIIA